MVSGECLGAVPVWTTLNAAVPDVASTMRRYLDQLPCVLRPRSVGNADQALRSLAVLRSADGVGEASGEVSDVCDQFGWFLDLEAEAEQRDVDGDFVEGV